MTMITSETIIDTGCRIQPLDWVVELGSAGYTIRRSWPRSVEHLLLELLAPSGDRVAGQWFADPARARRIARSTVGSIRRGSVVLQPGGADRRLLPLRDLLADRPTRLISHRPERRAVVATAAGHVKVLRPERLAQTSVRARAAERFGLGAPRVIAVRPADGLLITRTVSGVPLGARLGGPGAADACAAVGRSLARLHRLPVRQPDIGLPGHGPTEEYAVLQRWQQLAADHGLLPEPAPMPELTASGRRTLVHRDFHDGQVIMTAAGPAILDFDLLAIGDPALDLANFLTHLELRCEQGLLAEPEQLIEATLAGYRPDPMVRAALGGYRGVARARLRAVYAFRNPELLS